MTAEDKVTGKNRHFSEFFLSFGAGSHLFDGLTRAKAWNLVAWLLIIGGAFGWLIFLIWRP